MEAIKRYLEVISVISSKPVIWLFHRDVLDSKAGSENHSPQDISWSSTGVHTIFCFPGDSSFTPFTVEGGNEDVLGPAHDTSKLMGSISDCSTRYGNVSNSVSFSSQSPRLWGCLQKGPRKIGSHYLAGELVLRSWLFRGTSPPLESSRCWEGISRVISHTQEEERVLSCLS